MDQKEYEAIIKMLIKEVELLEWKLERAKRENEALLNECNMLKEKNTAEE